MQYPFCARAWQRGRRGVALPDSFGSVSAVCDRHGSSQNLRESEQLEGSQREITPRAKKRISNVYLRFGITSSLEKSITLQKADHRALESSGIAIPKLSAQPSVAMGYQYG